VALRSAGIGAYAPDERHLVFVGSSYGGGGPLVIVGHGAGGTAWDYNTDPSWRRDLDLLADAGCVVVAADLGGDTWGNDTFLAMAEAVIDWAESTWDADVSKVSWIGDSMSGGTALNWAWRNTGRIGALVLRVPGVAYDNIYHRIGFLTESMDDAYGGDWSANVADRDPSANTEAIAEFADRVRIYYSTNDPLISLEQDIRPFAEATGIRAIPLGDVGHDPATVFPAVHAQAQAQFILSQL